MEPDHAHIWVQPPAAPVQHLDAQSQPAPDYQQEKIAPDDMLLLGMLLYMEQGLTLDWLFPEKEEEEDSEGVFGHRHS